MENNTYTLFSGTTKMADILLQNPTLLSLLARFEIHLGFGENSVNEVCALSGIESSFFILVCNVYTFDNYLPLEQELKGLDLSALVEYLKRSHRYYIERKIDLIEQLLQNMNGLTTQRQIVSTFFSEYKQEIINHFQYEEQVVFPYIKSIAEGSSSVNYHIHQYEENHSNIDDKLSDLKNILIKYLPESGDTEVRMRALEEIFLFEEDLLKHTRIEDKILIPFVQKIENGYAKK